MLPAALLAVAVATLPALAAAPDHVDVRTATAVHGDLGPATGEPASWALRALDDHFAADGRRVEIVRESLVGTHVRGREHRDGVPVDGTDWLVSAIDGRVVQVESFSAPAGEPVAAPVGDAAARATALAHLGVQRLLVPAAVERVLVTRDGRLTDVYRVSVVAAAPARAAVVEVDAATGRVLGVTDDARYADGSAKLFDPNPIVTKRDVTLRQPAELRQPADLDLDSPELTAQRRVLPLRGLDPTALRTGRLSGPWVNVIAPGYNATTTPGTYDLTRSDPRFEGLMAYAHLDRFQRHLQSLGFRGSKGVNAEPQEVVATRVEGYDNSFYMPATDLMLLGTGGVDDGEDAEVILHEYGHAVQYAQVPGYGRRPEGGAMGEGFGDFLAGTWFARTSGGFNDVCLMEWDSTSYRDGPQTCIRRMDVKKRYPDDLKNQVHADGEIWSTFLWQVRGSMKGTAAQKTDSSLRLVLTMHELLTPQAEFADAVAGLRTAARALRHPEWVPLIDRAAKARGLPLGR